MAFNSSPKVAAARSIANEFGKNQVIVLMIAEDEGWVTVEYASYGKTRQMCAEAQEIADEAYEAVMAHLRRDAEQSTEGRG